MKMVPQKWGRNPNKETRVMAESKLISLNEVKEAAENFLLLEDTNIIDVACAIYVANKFPSDPLWMFLTGPPSSAKTEILRAMDGHDNVTLLSSLTPQTLISGKRIKGAGNQSLLPKLNGNLLIVKDFGTILSMYREARGEIFAQLREIYDGQYSKAFGTGESIEWKGKLGILAATTPVIDKYLAVNQMLGERFLHYRVGDENALGIAGCAFRNVFEEEDDREIFRNRMDEFLAQFDKDLTVDMVEISDVRERIMSLAVLCAHARSAVYRNRRDQSLEAMPQPEGPARLVKQFKLLAFGLATVRNEKEINNGIYEIVKKTAKDTLPRLRLQVLEALWQMYQEDSHDWPKTREVALKAGMPTTTAKLKLENLHLLRLINRDTSGDGDKSAYIWQPSDLMRRLVETSHCFT